MLVAIAFPEAFAGGVPQARGGGAERAGVPAMSGDGATATLAVWPNPSAGAVSVRLGSASGTATVAVFDALGRRVAVLHDGAVPDGGLSLTLDGAQLPAGVYVVYARVSGASAQTLVQRVTITR